MFYQNLKHLQKPILSLQDFWNWTAMAQVSQITIQSKNLYLFQLE